MDINVPRATGNKNNLVLKRVRQRLATYIGLINGTTQYSVQVVTMHKQ